MFTKPKFIALATLLIVWASLFNAVWAESIKLSTRLTFLSSQSSGIRRLSPSDLTKLRWIEGTWRGTGDVESPFFERYYFENDSTLVVEGFSDETLSKVSDVTRFELRDGQFGNWGEGARWTVMQLDDNSVTFEPVARARNTFRWEKQSKDVWKAVLSWPAKEGSPAKQRIYKMERWSTPKK